MWLKLSDDFGDDCARLKLSDAAFRTLVESLLWAMRRENGGSIDNIDIRRFAESSAMQTAVTELVKKKCWSRTESGFQVKMHMEHQIEPHVITARRQKEALRQKKYRAKKAEVPIESYESRRDDLRDETRDPGLVRTGQDGSGREESTHLRKEIEKDDIDMCTDCGVEPCNCHQGWLQSGKESGLHEIWEPGGETNGWTSPSG